MSRVYSLVLVCLSAGPVAAQPGQPAPDPLDRLNALEQRLEALEAENARLRRPPAAEPGAPPDPRPHPGAMDQLVERLGTRYSGGFVLVDSPDRARVPYQLRLNVFNQFRYLNQQLDDPTFTDNLGTVRPVDGRNDFSLNRNLFYFNGYVLDPKLTYNLIIWSSNSVATVIQGGYFGYEFDKRFKLYAGYWGIPGSRTLTRDFMFLPGVERSMADNFFRPGFTQGVWAEGDFENRLFYTAYVGNSLNTLSIASTRLDRNLVYSGSVWWEPLAPYGPPGPYRTAYSDLEFSDRPAVRLGTSFTGAREDRFSGLDRANPENVALFNSDGTLFFATGSLAPGVTVLLANYYMWAQDVGFKYRGLAFNMQYYLRWLDSFRADGPLPVTNTFDHGFEASLGYFVLPKKLELYGRTSFVFGEFRTSNEYAVGANWHPLGNRNFRLIAEANRVQNSPVGSVITPYTAGMSGWNLVLQTQLYF